MHDGWTALAYASMNGFYHIVDRLIKAGADLNTKDRLRRNPLHWAARFNNVFMAQKLLEMGISYQEPDN